MSATPEARVKADIRAWLKARGIYYAQPIGAAYGATGVPDFLCCWRGRFLAIEAKAPGRRSDTTARQRENLQKIQQANGLAIVVDDVSQLDDMENNHDP